MAGRGIQGAAAGRSPGALAEMGVEVPPGQEVRVVKDTERVRHLVIPPSPSEELSEEQLDQVAGGIERCACFNHYYQG